ncbi:hypothetical protein M758_10G166600 [Ceratodon purpureus]|nr:hypothetical protein M758_10G166600 [Ceratodon purpureus]
MGNGRDERKGNLLASAVVGAAGLALGWAALELGTGGILTRGREAMDRSFEPKEIIMEGDQAVLLVEEVKDRDTRTQTQIEEDEIVQALDEGTNHTKRDKERGTSKWRS